MKFILLHFETGTAIMVNFDRVDSFHAARLHPGTVITFRGEDYINVTEGVTEILTRLDAK